jgi:hypothetical protein
LSGKKAETDRRYRSSAKGRETIRRNNERSNERRLFVNSMYLGMAGFTKKEREALLGDGPS